MGKWLADISRACLVIAIGALGVKTSFEDLSTPGWQLVVLMVAEPHFSPLSS